MDLHIGLPLGADAFPIFRYFITIIDQNTRAQVIPTTQHTDETLALHSAIEEKRRIFKFQCWLFEVRSK